MVGDDDEAAAAAAVAADELGRVINVTKFDIRQGT